MLKPLWECLRETSLVSSRLFVDETRAPVLDPGRGRTKTGYFSTLARDERPWGSSDPPAVLLLLSAGEGAEQAIALLKGFAGVLQTDGYAAYQGLTNSNSPSGGVTLADCGTHVPQVFDIAQRSPSPIAAEAFKRIAVLYQIEADIRGETRSSPAATKGAPTGALRASLIEACKLDGVRSSSMADQRAHRTCQQLAQHPSRRTSCPGPGRLPAALTLKPNSLSHA